MNAAHREYRLGGVTLPRYLKTVDRPDARARGMKLSSTKGFIPIEIKKSMIRSVLKNESRSLSSFLMSVPTSSESRP